MNNREKILIILLEYGLLIGGQWFLLSNLETNGIWEWVISSAVLLGIVPILTIKYFFRERLARYFICLRSENGGWIGSILSFLLFFGLMGIVVVKLGWYQQVPVSRWLISGSASLVVFVDLILMPFVIVANEIFFRGLVMTSLARWLGSLWGIVGQAFLAVGYGVFFLKGFHLERVSMLLVLNIFLGWICFKQRTIVASALANWIIYLLLDFIVLYQIYQIK